MAETKNLWGGRFTGKADSGFAEFNCSFGFDRRLFEADIRASIAHCNGLVGARVLTPAEAAKINAGLGTILERGLTGPSYFDNSQAEDIHSFIEAQLVDLIGTLGQKLHTGRSRNDQVAADLRLWLREAIAELTARVRSTQEALLDFAEAHQSTILPGYTHLQRAQPIMLAFWSLAYFEMLTRDSERLTEVRRRVNVSPLGSAALAGTSYSIDREAVAHELGFESVSHNSLDAVSDRDFCVDFASACSLVMVHLSRLAEDVILYSTTEFGFFGLRDTVATGSSLMPQKKNPDSMELVRGKAGRVFGHLTSLLTMLKGLPLAYNKDMQEDKEAVFDSFDTVSTCLDVTATVLRNVRVNEEAMLEAATKGYMNATELADYLVRKGMPFREAHETVGHLVVLALERDVELQELSLAEIRSFSNLIDEDVLAALSLEKTLETKSRIGGTSRGSVSQALAEARAKLSS
jgi:argininosuccinate lyase